MALNGITQRSSVMKTFGIAILSVTVLAIFALAIIGVSAPVDARFPINNFTNVDDTATVTPHGQNVAISGWVKCTEDHIAEIRVTVIQGSTEAKGKTHVRCLGQKEVQTWTIHVTPHGPDTFDVKSSVHVDAWAVTRSQGKQTDGPHTWSNNGVELISRY